MIKVTIITVLSTPKTNTVAIYGSYESLGMRKNKEFSNSIELLSINLYLYVHFC